VHRAIAAEFAKNSSAHWVAKLEAAGLPCGPIYTIDQVFADPQVRHVQIQAAMEHPRTGKTPVIASPLTFNGSPKTIRRPTEINGAHTEEVLLDLGYTGEEIQAMRQRGSI
jgi:crotonobetainyl-CoA:carnitine CoA-transferase CaiB-like acyl-CoA transferase